MEHERVCPRCGQPSDGYGFCSPCRADLDALREVPAVGAAQPTDAPVAAAQAPHEAPRLEQVLAATSDGALDTVPAGMPAAAIETDDSRPRTEDAPRLVRPRGLEMPKPATSAGAALTPAAHPPRDVARFEQLLRLAPDVRPEQAAAAPPATAPEARPDVAEKTTPEPRVSEPSYVAAHALRSAVWFELAAAFRPEADPAETAAQAAEAPAPEASVAPPVADSTSGVDAAPAESVAPPEPPEAAVQDDAHPALEVGTAQSARSDWLTAVCLLLLAALVVVLTGRAPRATRRGTSA